MDRESPAAIRTGHVRCDEKAFEAFRLPGQQSSGIVAASDCLFLRLFYFRNHAGLRVEFSSLPTGAFGSELYQNSNLQPLIFAARQ